MDISNLTRGVTFFFIAFTVDAEYNPSFILPMSPQTLID